MNGMDADADLYTDLPSVYWCKTTEDKGHPQLFKKKDCFLDLTINSENIASHKYVLQKAKSLWIAGSQTTGYSFLVLIEKSQTLLFEAKGVCCKSIAICIVRSRDFLRKGQTPEERQGSWGWEQWKLRAMETEKRNITKYICFCPATIFT